MFGGLRGIVAKVGLVLRAGIPGVPSSSQILAAVDGALPVCEEIDKVLASSDPATVVITVGAGEGARRIEIELGP